MLCRYCALLHSPNAVSNHLPELPAVAYSTATLEVAGALLRQPAGERPALAVVEGLPCRAGFADAAIAFLEGLMRGGSASPSQQAAHSSSLAEALLAMLSPSEGANGSAQAPALDLSPCGVLSACHALAALIAARPHDALLPEARVRWLLRLLAPEHMSALIVWPTHFSGNRKGVMRLLDTVCLPLQQPLVNQELAANDPVVRRHATALQVCSTFKQERECDVRCGA